MSRVVEVWLWMEVPRERGGSFAVYRIGFYAVWRGE